MLLIDSGNSAIKCRLLKQGAIIDSKFPFYHDAGCRAFEEYLTTIKTTKIVLACVSSKVIKQRIIHSIQHYQPAANFTCLTSMPQLNGLENGYRDFTLLGVDRWLTLMAVSPLHKDYIIIDAGSAITIDLLARDKGHLGGAILPGFRTERERFKAMFPRVDFSRVTQHSIKHPGQDTASCIDLSQAPFTVSGVTSILSRWRALLRSPCEILLSGQDAEMLRNGLNDDSRIVPDLVFRGMLKQIQLLG